MHTHDLKMPEPSIQIPISHSWYLGTNAGLVHCPCTKIQRENLIHV